MRNKGFTLLEVMMAITVLTIAVGGSFALIQQTLVAASLNKSKAIAYYLAQEGIEMVKNIRDSNWLEQRTNPTIAWNDGLAAGQWQLDYQDTALTRHYNGGQLLNINENGFYSYSPGVVAPFKRKVSVAELGADSLEVSVEVEWSERGRDHAIQVVEYLYNWYGY